MTKQDIPYILALWRTPGIGPAEFKNLIKKFSSPQVALKQINPDPDWLSVEKDLRWSEQPNHHIILIDMPHYPQRLKEIAAAPPLLFVDGDCALLNSLQLAIVGSRTPTPSGLDNAYQFANSLAKSDLTITSGLALGIDAAAHEGTLRAKGKTLAVLGAGIDVIYPKRHQALAKRITENGALISEYPTSVKALAHNFPRRNRIISGLSLGVLVVEAAYGSGSLITARYALEQNREVLAIPGSIHNPLARGCHALIKQGAKLVESAADVLEEILPTLSFKPPSHESERHDPSLKILDANHAKILNSIGYETTSVDLIIERSGLTAEQVSSILLLLELAGVIASVPGGFSKKGVK